jgi:hypothetical protein
MYGIAIEIMMKSAATAPVILIARLLFPEDFGRA